LKLLMSFVTVLLIASMALAGSISGTVTAKEGGDALVGANVYLKGTTVGAATDENGQYYIKVDDGNYTVVCDYVGYATEEADVAVSGNTVQDFGLVEYLFAKTISVVADRAKERETPVAFTNVSKQTMEMQLGSQDIPMVLNTTPSVYATMQGGGAGDARINVRGFNQRNVAIMINGVPVNDMENGWVYWSNWDGVGDATASIQMQRGLSAVNLATPSIGGTMNIITDPTAQNSGVKFKQEFGNDGFLKSTLMANSGLIDGKYAVSGGVVRKVGDGLIDGTYTDAWAYYLGAAYNLDENNRLELYAIGAPQYHGQNLYMQNIAAYSKSYAESLDDYDPNPDADHAGDATAFEKFKEAGRTYNENYNTLTTDYNGQQYWNTSTHDRLTEGFMMERENYYHKPQVNLNWYSQLNKDLSLYTIAYYSGGQGGGSGTYGSVKWDYSGPSRIVDWDATIANNTVTDTARGILRNSVNNQWTIGAISKAYYKVNNNTKVSFGLDWRTAEIDHYREVRDLLGGKFYIDQSNQFDSPSQYKKALGDKIAYDFTNTVDWFGFYGQGEYTAGALSAYGMYGWSTLKYSYVNHFVMNDAGDELSSETPQLTGYQAKGGASYRISNMLDVFGNVGLVSKAPIFDNVIDDGDGTVIDDPKNEQFTSFEAGVNFRGLEGTLSLKGNFYYTKWTDRAYTRGFINADGSEGLVAISGMNALHTGFEFEAAYQPMSLFRIDAAASIGNWTYLDDVEARVKDYSGTANETVYQFYVKDLKVGDAPQTQLALAASLFPVKGLTIQGIYKYNADYYSAFDPFSRTDETDRAQVWQVPSYGVMDLHFTYDLPINWQGVNLQLFGHVFNVMDEEYIQDAVDNSSYNAYTANGKNHMADDAEVFMGLPRTWNFGLNIVY
jgi:iron complex outermembrane receptor protein